MTVAGLAISKGPGLGALMAGEAGHSGLGKAVSRLCDLLERDLESRGDL